MRTYEQHCDTLGVGYNADKYEIKLNYRKLAKKYHPDINKAADATAKFQEVNNAYDFLSNEQNIERYNRIKNKNSLPLGEYLPVFLWEKLEKIIKKS